MKTDEIRIMHSDRGIYEIKFPEKIVLGFLSNEGEFFDTVDLPEDVELKTSSRTEKYRYWKYLAQFFKNVHSNLLNDNATMAEGLLTLSNKYKNLQTEHESLEETKRILETDYDRVRSECKEAKRKAMLLDHENDALALKYAKLRERHREDISYICEFSFFKWLVRIFRK